MNGYFHSDVVHRSCIIVLNGICDERKLYQKSKEELTVNESTRNSTTYINNNLRALSIRHKFEPSPCNLKRYTGSSLCKILKYHEGRGMLWTLGIVFEPFKVAKIVTNRLRNRNFHEFFANRP